MAKLTMEQVKKYNSKCENGFKFDTQYYLFHNEKTLRKLINLGDNKVVESKIMYRDELKRVIQSNGIGYNTSTGKKQPTLHISLYHIDENGTGVSHGLGQWINIGEVKEKSMFSYLQKLTSEVTEEKIMNYYNEKECLNDKIL